MRFIVITSPDFICDEAEQITRLFDCGLDTLHLRKPGASVEDCARLLCALPERCLRNVVIHEHFTLCRDYGLAGVHLNRRNPSIPDFVLSDRLRYSVSASCHSIAEAAEKKESMDYVFLSPVFDSISKRGYGAAYSHEELAGAAVCGTVDSRVVALGGVDSHNIARLREWNFGGAAFLGDVWSRVGSAGFCRHARLLADRLHG